MNTFKGLKTPTGVFIVSNGDRVFYGKCDPLTGQVQEIYEWKESEVVKDTVEINLSKSTN